MSATRRLRKALTGRPSSGTASTVLGLSSVGPPPSIRMSHELATFRITGSRSSTVVAPSTFSYQSRLRSWSLTTRKWVTTKPSDGAGKSVGPVTRTGSHRLGHPQVGERDLALGDVDDLDAHLLGEGVPQGGGRIAGRLHRVPVGVGDGRRRPSGGAVDQQARRAEARDLVQLRDDARSPGVEDAVHLA